MSKTVLTRQEMESVANSWKAALKKEKTEPKNRNEEEIAGYR